MTDKNTDFHQNNLLNKGDGSDLSCGGIMNRKTTININGLLMDFSTPKVMGILNLTPDSFYDGGKYNNEVDSLKQTELMISEGADFIDVGAYSSRPNAKNISLTEELNRIKPIIKSLIREFPEVKISVDTFRAEVAEAAIGEGAVLINDISGGELDQEMFKTVAKLKVPYILMHMKGSPQTMVNESHYTNIVSEVTQYFLKKIKDLRSLGVLDIIIDPGFGFAKTPNQSFELLNNLNLLKILEVPILAGLSRKSMIYKSLNISPENALNGTTAANTIALLKGANMLRVHDVKPALEAIQLVKKLNP